MTSSRIFGLAAALVTLSGNALAHNSFDAQICSLGSGGVGKAGAVICQDVRSGAMTQSISVGNTVSAAGGIGGSLSRHGSSILVTNLDGGAVLLQESHGRLKNPIKLSTGVEGSLSGALSERGAYVLTATRVLFFANGQTQPTTSQRLLVGDGSAAQVTLAGGYAYVSEKNGSLEAFQLGNDGNLFGSAQAVNGIPAGVIVGIAGHDALVIAPVAHLASNANQSAVPVVSGVDEVQLVQTKEVAACWTATSGDEACVSNPGSMTISCGHIGPGGFTSYTSAAANPTGDAVFDIAMSAELFGVLATRNGAPQLLVYTRADADSDFLSLVGQSALGSAAATGVLLLPPLQ
jgi:hypothetical protein